MGGALVAVVIALALVSIPTRAHAQDVVTPLGSSAVEPASEPAPDPPVAVDVPVEPALTTPLPPETVVELPRWFAATAIDLGFLYFRPRISAGWGRPHDAWIGAEANPIFAGTSFGAYAGIRAALSWIDLRIGARAFYPFERSFLLKQESYDRLDLQSRAGEHARYVSAEAELSVEAPLGPGDLLATVSGTYVIGVPELYNVFEETLRVVVDPPLVWRARLGYGVRLGPNGAVRIAFVGEVLNVPKRNSVVLRAGIVASVRVFVDLEVRATFVPIVFDSNDSIGIAGADFAQLGLRYFWETQ